MGRPKVFTEEQLRDHRRAYQAYRRGPKPPRHIMSAEERLQRHRAAYARDYASTGAHPVSGSRPDKAALAERDALLMLPQSLTAELMGDPRPGRSALDLRQQANNKETPA